MQFAVLHICKYKNLGGIGAHIDRKYISKNVDISKTYFNEKIENNGTLGSIMGNIKKEIPLKERKEEEFVSPQCDLEIEVSKKINAKI